MNILKTQNAIAYPVVARSTVDEYCFSTPPDAAPSTRGCADTAERPISKDVVRRARRLPHGLRLLAGGAMLAGLMACGSMPGERAASGAGIGAGAGAAVGAVTGMGVGTGAAIGAAAGAAAGGLTKEKDIDLGKPIWK